MSSVSKDKHPPEPYAAKAYLIVAADLPSIEGGKLSSQEVFDLMHSHSCWEFPAVSGQAKLKKGDLLFFYLGGKARRIVGEAVVQGERVAITKDSVKTFDRSLYPYFVWRMPVKNFNLYESNAANLDFLMQLSIAKSSKVTRPYVGLILRVGMRSLSADDVQMIRTTVGETGRTS